MLKAISIATIAVSATLLCVLAVVNYTANEAIELCHSSGKVPFAYPGAPGRIFCITQEQRRLLPGPTALLIGRRPRSFRS